MAIRRKVTRSLATMALAAIVGTTAACSSGSGGDSSAGNADGPVALAEAADYDGPEADLPTEYPAPDKIGEKVTIGYSCAACQVPGVALAADQAEKEVADLGGTFILLDAGGDGQKQLNQFKQLVAQGADAIVIQPLVETAMAPAFKDAKASGVDVITIGSPGDTSQPLLEGVVSNVTFGLDRSAFEKAQHLAMHLPKGAKVGVVGFGVPSDSVKYGVDRTGYWAEKFGLTVAERTDVSELTVAAGQTAGSGLLQRDPDIRAVVSFTDAISAGVLAAARQLNRSNVSVCANDYDKAGYTVVSGKTGSCSVRWSWEDLGGFAARAAYLAATDQGGDLPPVVTTGGGELVTEDNYQKVKVVG